MMNEINAEAVQARIREAVRGETELSDAAVNDIAFHMTDWLRDLEAYVRFCNAPKEMSDAEVDELLRCFLLHVPNHVAAAGKLFTGVPVTDVFGVGAVSEDAD